jgi:predicted nucleotidyltransferase
MKSTARASRAWCCSVRARGDAQPDSDYDLAVFLRDYAPGTTTELYRLADLSTAILDETGEFIHAMPYPAGSYTDPRMPLMYAIRTEGIDL